MLPANNINNPLFVPTIKEIDSLNFVIEMNCLLNYFNGEDTSSTFQIKDGKLVLPGKNSITKTTESLLFNTFIIVKP